MVTATQRRRRDERTESMHPTFYAPLNAVCTFENTAKIHDQKQLLNQALSTENLNSFYEIPESFTFSTFSVATL